MAKETKTENNIQEEKLFPSMHLVYDLAIKELMTAAQRSDHADEVTDKQRVFFTTLTLAFMAFILPGLDVYQTNYALLAIAIFLFAVGTVLSFYAIRRTAIATWNIETLRDGHSHKTEWKFQSDFTYNAREVQVLNKKAVDHKYRISFYAMISFTIEVIFLFLWLFSVPAR